MAITSSAGMGQAHAHAALADDHREVKIIHALDNRKAMAIQQNLMEEPEFASVLAYLTEKRGITKEVLQKYCVGAIEQPFRDSNGDMVGTQCISFPWMARQDDLNAMGVFNETTAGDDEELSTPDSNDKNLFGVVRLKIRGVEDKSKQRLIPKGGSWGLFGWNTVAASAEELVLTEGEFDAMAVHQATGMPAISLPNGCQSLPPSVLPLLERFKKIYLWMDNDAPGQSSVEKFASKLGVARCYIVRPPPELAMSKIKDANDALLAGLDLGAFISAADRIPHSNIATFDELRREVFDEIVNPVRACGVQSRTLPSLNRLLKGHRMGEVTVLTGPTGCGKTTLLSQLSLDLCGQGVNTLWGSFEIKNTRLIHKMLNQLAGHSLAGDVKGFEATADAFETLPMYFMRFFGSTDVDEVLDAMEYAVYAYDVQHILLDNLQFMMSGQGRGFDKFERQDAALDKFRRFATQKNVHLTLVIHPRKEQEDADLTLSSVFGTAKATQEADNVLILQRTRGQNKLDVRKNRFDGSLGSIPLRFDADASSLRELHDEAMDERVASIDLEAEMARAQELRAKQKQQHQQVYPLVDADESAALHLEPIEFHMTPVSANSKDFGHEEVDSASTTTDFSFSTSSANGVNAVNGINGAHSSITSEREEGEDDRQWPNGSASGLNGSGSTSNGAGRLNGAGPSASHRDPEPFSMFTPIITR